MSFECIVYTYGLSYVVTLLINMTPAICERYKAWVVIKNGHEKDACFDVIGLYVENIDTVLCPVVTTDGYLIAQSAKKKISFYFLCGIFHLTMIMKLKMTICMIVRRQFHSWFNGHRWTLSCECPNVCIGHDVWCMGFRELSNHDEIGLCA